jgi:hypothetical protein
MLEIEDRCEIIVASLLGIDSPKKRRSFVKKDRVTSQMPLGSTIREAQKEAGW